MDTRGLRIIGFEHIDMWDHLQSLPGMELILRLRLVTSPDASGGDGV